MYFYCMFLFLRFFRFLLILFGLLRFRCLLNFLSSFFNIFCRFFSFLCSLKNIISNILNILWNWSCFLFLRFWLFGLLFISFLAYLLLWLFSLFRFSRFRFGWFSFCVGFGVIYWCGFGFFLFGLRLLFFCLFFLLDRLFPLILLFSRFSFRLIIGVIRWLLFFWGELSLCLGFRKELVL